MRIIGISVLEFRRTLDGKSWNPSFRWNERRAPLILLHADNGLVGIGEAWSRQDKIEQVLAHLAQTKAPLLVGREIGPRTLSPDGSAGTATDGAEPWVVA